MEHGYDKDALKKRLHRIEGQVRGIERMVDDDLLHRHPDPGGRRQDRARGMAFEILNDHVTHCVHDARLRGREDRNGEERGAHRRGRALHQDEVTMSVHERRAQRAGSQGDSDPARRRAPLRLREGRRGAGTGKPSGRRPRGGKPRRADGDGRVQPREDVGRDAAALGRGVRLPLRRPLGSRPRLRPARRGGPRRPRARPRRRGAPTTPTATGTAAMPACRWPRWCATCATASSWRRCLRSRSRSGRQSGSSCSARHRRPRSGLATTCGSSSSACP